MISQTLNVKVSKTVVDIPTMSTYGSAKILKSTLLFFSSMIFLIGCAIFASGIIDAVNSATNQSRHRSMNETHESNMTVIEDRFPSTASPSVVIIFGLITVSVSAVGITATNKEDLRLLATYSLMLVIGVFTRFVFFFATVCMHAFSIDYNPIRVTTLLSAGIATIELILVMCVCHFAKVIKRGDVNIITKSPVTSTS